MTFLFGKFRGNIRNLSDSHRMEFGIWNGNESYKRAMYSIPQMTMYLTLYNSKC
jgi:hypothetical protein